jgi:hypothetical protein
MPDAGGRWGIGLGIGLEYAKAPGRGPSWMTAALRAIGRYGFTTGSTEGTVVFEAPALVPGWRFLALARIERMQRTPFFGLANESPLEDSLQSRYGNLYYRYSLLRSTGLATIQRRIAGPLWLHLAGQLRDYQAMQLTQRPSLFEAAVAGAVPDVVRRSSAEARLGLLLDTRDDWAATTRGVFLEAIAVSGRLHAPAGQSGLSYRRYLLGAREFLAAGDSGRTVLALRQRLTLASDSLPFFLAWEQTTSWLPYDGIVGARTVRLHGGGRELSSNHAMLTVELRRKLLVPTDDPAHLRHGALWGYLFSDAALLWDPDESPSFDRHEWTVGAGFRLQLSKGSLTGVDVGWTDTGPNIAVLSMFAF